MVNPTHRISYPCELAETEEHDSRVSLEPRQLVTSQFTGFMIEYGYLPILRQVLSFRLSKEPASVGNMSLNRHKFSPRALCQWFIRDILPPGQRALSFHGFNACTPLKVRSTIRLLIL